MKNKLNLILRIYRKLDDTSQTIVDVVILLSICSIIAYCTVTGNGIILLYVVAGIVGLIILFGLFKHLLMDIIECYKDIKESDENKEETILDILDVHY